jgi:hypothetical protein
LWKQDVGLPQLLVPGSVIAFAAKWYGQKNVEFRSDYHDGHAQMVERAHQLMSEADAIVHYNGNTFDMPWLRTEFVQAGMTPPAPHKDIDLLRVVKKQFRFPSNKLAYVTKALDLSGKLSHTGHQMWVDCLQGDEETRRKAWNLMRRYNRQDVATTEELYTRLLPWITMHPHQGLFIDTDEPVCPRCASTNLQRRGTASARNYTYPRFQCTDCGGWAKGTKRERVTEGSPL